MEVVTESLTNTIVLLLYLRKMYCWLYLQQSHLINKNTTLLKPHKMLCTLHLPFSVSFLGISVNSLLPFLPSKVLQAFLLYALLLLVPDSIPHPCPSPSPLILCAFPFFSHPPLPHPAD